MPELEDLAFLISPGLLLSFLGAGLTLAAAFSRGHPGPRSSVVFALGQTIFMGGMLTNSILQQRSDQRQLAETVEALFQGSASPATLEAVSLQVRQFSGTGTILFAGLFGLTLGMLVTSLSPQRRAQLRRAAQAPQEV